MARPMLILQAWDKCQKEESHTLNVLNQDSLKMDHVLYLVIYVK